MRNDRGITLVTLVVTVIILAIIASVSASNITNEDKSAIAKANELASSTNEILEQHDTQINAITQEVIDENTSFRLTSTNFKDASGANEPVFISGLTPVTINGDGTTTIVTDKSNWYNYEQKQWANAESSDNSLWVWIPRFAYKITYTNDVNKSEGGSIDVVFLNGTSNDYYKNGVLTDATLENYVVHPCFKSTSNSGYTNGEWNKNLTGIWVAKFEAGFQQGDALTPLNNNISNVVRSNVNYSSGAVYLADVENGGSAGYNTARNYIDGIYGENISGLLTDLSAYNLKETKITYPVFKGATYSMNYISVDDAYRVCKALTDDGNIYGFNKKTADTHLMKNSEWGAVAYLSYSKYGTNGQRVYINNVSLNNSVTSVYGVTGYAGNAYGANPVATTVGANIWYSENGKMASSNHNITGVYDLVGGAWERVSAFVVNNYTETFGYSITRDTLNAEGTNVNTKYITAYSVAETDLNTNNYVSNSEKIGDAVVETSSLGDGSTSWNTATSMFPSLDLPFFARGGSYLFAGNSGLFNYGRTLGYGAADSGFRAVISAVNASVTGGKTNE